MPGGHAGLNPARPRPSIPHSGRLDSLRTACYAMLECASAGAATHLTTGVSVLRAADRRRGRSARSAAFGREQAGYD
jgi:hypothetical protein